MKRLFFLILIMCCYAVPATAAPQLLYSTGKITGNVHSLFADTNGLIYASLEYGGVRIFDSKTEGDWNLLGSWNQAVNGFNAPSRELTLVDDVLIVTNRQGGTRFLDVSDPENPTLITTIDNPTAPFEGATVASTRLAVDGNMLYVASVRGGFSRIDISDVRNPKPLDNIYFQTASGSNYIEGQGISIADNYAFVATPWNGWSIVDISDLTRMEIVNSIPKPDGSSPGVWDVHVKNGIAYVLAQGYGVQIFNVSDVKNVSLISEVLLPAFEGYGPDEPPADIQFLSANIAAVSYGSLGVYIYDFSNLEDPLLLSTLTADEMVAVNMFLQNNELYVAGFKGGIFVFDVSEFAQTPIPASLALAATGLAALLRKKRKELRAA